MTTLHQLVVLTPGSVPYGVALEMQKELVVQRRAGEVPDTLIVLEHPRVITMGSSSHLDHILADEAERERLGIGLHEAEASDGLGKVVEDVIGIRVEFLQDGQQRR